MPRERVKGKALRPEHRSAPASPIDVAPTPAPISRSPGNAIEAIARSSTGPAPSRVPLAVTRALAGERGTPLPAPNLWSQRVGTDVGNARIVVSIAAAEAAAAVHARAFTVGDRVFFAEGNDTTTDGGDLLAHELVHVAQQRSAPAPPSWNQLPFVEDDDAREREARDHGASSPGTSPMAIARAPSDPPMSGALVFADDLHKKSRADDQFTGPITWSVLGDAFEVALGRSREREDELVVSITYVGTYPVDSFWMPGKVEAARTQRISTQRRPPLAERKDLPFNTKVLGRRSDAISYDLFGDGVEILVIKDTVDADGIATFDRRSHMMSVAINGYPMGPRWFEVHLPTDVTTGREAILSRKLTLLRDHFTLRARRHGDASAVVLSIANATHEQQVVVPYAAKRKLALDVLRDDGAMIEIDLDCDHRVDATLVHTVRQYPPPGRHRHFRMAAYDLLTGETRPEPAPYYLHELAAYDPGGVLLGRMIHKMEGYAGAVPPAQDALTSPAPAGAPQPATKAPQQGDVYGEAPRAIQSTGRDWELRVDGDGDRTKELLLRFIPQQPDTYDKPQVFTFRVTQISTGISGEADFRISAKQANGLSLFGPRVETTPDGHTFGTIDLGGATLEYGRSNADGTPAGFIRYDFRFGNVTMSFYPPFDLAPTTTSLLKQNDNATGAVPTKNVAGVLAAEIQLTEYRDRFRATVQRIGEDDVLFGLAAMQDGAAVGGLQTRLLWVHDLRLEEFSVLPDRASFLVGNGMDPLNITSALDPPKDEEGRPIQGVPPASHRDHRVTVWGHYVLGDVSRTFPVRNGKFVQAGWEKNSEAQIAAGNTDAVGVLQEQAKHPHLAELRVQIDSAIDSAVINAVEKRYISQREADDWTALKTAMVFITSQATTAATVDLKKVDTAIASAKRVDDWLELETNTKGNFTPVDGWRAEQNLSGEWNGTFTNDFTGATFEIRRSKLVAETKNSTTIGRVFASSLRAHLWQSAIDWYAKFRDGVRRWIQVLYQRDAKDGETSAAASQLDYLGKMDTELGKLDKIQAERRSLDAAIDREVGLAAKKGLIPDELGKVWITLREGMVALTALTGGEALDKTMAAVCVTNALAVSTWLAKETAEQVNEVGNFRGYRYTGEVQAKTTSGAWVVQAASFGQRVATYIDQNKPVLAGEAYNRLRDAVVRWLATKYTTDPNLKDAEASARLGKLQKDRAGKRDVVRVPAIYQADESFEKEADAEGYKQADFGKYKTVPLTVFVWADDGKWQIRDVTNPDHVWNPTSDVDFNDEDQPPEALFKLLDNHKHLPKGHLTYLLPDGTGKKIRLESKKKWYEYVREWAMVIGLIALALLGGAVVAGFLFATVAAAMTAVAVPVFIASTLSAVMSVTADVAEIVDGASEGWLDSTTLFMDVLDIAVNLVTLGAGGAGKLAMGAEAAANAEKAGTGAAWIGFKAFAGKAGSMLYKPLMGLSIAGNALNAVVMTHDMIVALEDIEKIPDPVERLKARAQLIATWAASSAMIVLSLHGDLPAFGKGAPTIVLDNVNGRTVARAVDVSVGKAHVNVPKTSANAYASARWAAEEVEHTATSGRGKARSEAAAALEDQNFRDWYANWLENPARIDEHGKVVVPSDTPTGYAERTQAMVDRGDTALQRQAFGTADEVATLRRKAGEAGLDLDPHGENWRTTRIRLEDELAKTMGPERARTVVSRYEAARLGGKGDGVDFVVQRGKVGNVLPETEIDRITHLYEGNEVHVTGDLTSPQGGGKSTGVVEIAVVVPNDTSPEVMAAMEQRARNHKVLPDPEFSKATGHDTLELRAKVMTEDQFFGMATASRKGKASPRYVRIDQPVAGAVELGVQNHQHSPTHYSVETGAIDRARANMAAKHPEGRVGKIKYDPHTNTAYFEVHGTKAGGVVRVEAALPPRITGAGDWGHSNRILGTHVFVDADGATAALRRVHGGDLASLGETVGVHPPENAAEAGKGVEFGVGQLSDGRYVLVKGKVGAIDWSEMPGITGRSHTHPDFEATNLSPDAAGRQRPVPLVEIDRPPAPGQPPLLDGATIQPSGADVVYAAQHGGGHQGVLTPYVVQDGMVYKPGHGPPLPEQVPQGARLEYEITGAVELGTLGEDGPAVVRAELQGSFDGKPVSRKTVWATAPTPAEKAGIVHLSEPEGIVAKRAAPQRGARVERVEPPAKPELTPAQIAKVEAELAAVVTEQMAVHKLPAASTPEVRVLPDFEARFSSERGRAVFQLEGDKGVIYAHPEARKLDIASEMEHVRQLEDPKLAAEIRILHDGALRDQWKALPASERIGHFRRKLDLEIDAAEHLLAKQPAGSPEHTEVNKMLDDLRAIRDEVDAFTPTDIIAMNAGVKPRPQYLETPPWLFSKNRDKSARPARPAKIDKKDLVALPSGKTTAEEQRVRSTQYNDPEVDTVYQVGNSWKEHDDLHSGYNGTVTRRTGAGGKKFLVVTNESGVAHVYEYSGEAVLEPRFANAPDESIPVAQRPRVEIKAGEKFGAEPAREYRWTEAEYKDGRPPKLVEEIKSVDDKLGWRERGAAKTERGDILERAAVAQEDARLGPRLDADGNVKYAHLPSQEGRAGFDDIIVEFGGTREKPTAKLRVREVKDYPNKTVPYGEYTAITDNVETNWEHIGNSIEEARIAAIANEPMPAGFENMTKEQVFALEAAFKAKRVKVEIVLGPGTKANPVGRKAGVHDQLKAAIEAKLGKGALVDTPTTVEDQYVKVEVEKNADKPPAKPSDGE